MCVVAASYKGVGIPPKPTMKDMYDSNPDGAGFAYALNKRVYIEKGFMTYDDFTKALDDLEDKLKVKYNLTLKDISIMFHFRIGTHGPNSAELTHPFPISSQKKHFDALDLYTDVVMAHNGIIRSVTPITDWSDTTQYVKDVLHPLYLDNKDFYKSEHIQRLIENTINGSRFVFLDKHGEFTYIGDWVESKEAGLEGIKFSNLNHEDNYLSYYSGYGSYYDSAYTEYYESVFVKELPIGTILAHNSDFDADFKYDTTAKHGVVGAIPTNKYYVDDLGEIYVDYGFGYIMPSYNYDIAISDFTEDAVFNWYSSNSIDLIKKPMEEKTVLKYRASTKACKTCK
jgi:predicted glutamine amidotransferase